MAERLYFEALHVKIVQGKKLWLFFNNSVHDKVFAPSTKTIILQLINFFLIFFSRATFFSEAVVADERQVAGSWGRHDFGVEDQTPNANLSNDSQLPKWVAQSTLTRPGIVALS